MRFYLVQQTFLKAIDDPSWHCGLFWVGTISAPGRLHLEDFSVVFFVVVLSSMCVCFLCLILFQIAAFKPEAHSVKSDGRAGDED